MRQGATSPTVDIGRSLYELSEVGQTVGLTRTRTNTGEHHDPVGISKRPDYLIESIRICPESG